MAISTLNDSVTGPSFLSSIRWGKAVQAGLVVGSILFLVSRGMPWIASGAIDPAVMGREIAPGREATPMFLFGVLGLHLLASAIYALILAPIVHAFRPFMAGMVGGIAGLILYLLNYAIIGALMEAAPAQSEWPPLILHLAFGIITAEAYKGMVRRRETIPLM